jgi:hypothetical protein
MSTPISAVSTSAARCLTPGIVISKSLCAANGDPLLDLRREPVDRFVEEVDVRESVRPSLSRA